MKTAGRALLNARETATDARAWCVCATGDAWNPCASIHCNERILPLVSRQGRKAGCNSRARASRAACMGALPAARGGVCLSIVSYERAEWIRALLTNALALAEPSTRIGLHLNARSPFAASGASPGGGRTGWPGTHTMHTHAHTHHTPHKCAHTYIRSHSLSLSFSLSLSLAAGARTGAHTPLPLVRPNRPPLLPACRARLL